jgi:hypothetical protein
MSREFEDYSIALTTAWFAWKSKRISEVASLARKEIQLSTLQRAFRKNRAEQRDPASWEQFRGTGGLLGHTSAVMRAATAKSPASEAFFRGLAALVHCEPGDFYPPLGIWLPRMAWHLIRDDEPFCDAKVFSEPDAAAYCRFLLARLSEYGRFDTHPAFARHVALQLFNSKGPTVERQQIENVASAIAPALSKIAIEQERLS